MGPSLTLVNERVSLPRLWWLGTHRALLRPPVQYTLGPQRLGAGSEDEPREKEVHLTSPKACQRPGAPEQLSVRGQSVPVSEVWAGSTHDANEVKDQSPRLTGFAQRNNVLCGLTTLSEVKGCSV